MSRAADVVQLTRLDAQVKEESNAICTRHTLNGAVSVWRRERKLGQGGFGEVYREVCTEGREIGALRAVKIIQKQRTGGFDYSKELEAMARFSQVKYQQSFVKSLGWFDTTHSVCIAMEYVDSGDLQQYVGHCMPETEMQLIVSQVLEGLACMHTLSYAHRDLKPANLLVFNNGPRWHIKISDFGLSKRVAEGLTSLRTAAGTYGYMAPEVSGLLEDDDSDDESRPSYNNAVDIWALGVITYQMLTAQLPFEAGDLRPLKKYVRGKSIFPREALEAKKISGSGIAWIHSCMNPSPDARPGAGFSRRHQWPMAAESSSKADGPSQRSLPVDSRASASWDRKDDEDASFFDKIDEPSQRPLLAGTSESASFSTRGHEGVATLRKADEPVGESTPPKTSTSAGRNVQDSGYETVFRSPSSDLVQDSSETMTSNKTGFELIPTTQDSSLYDIDSATRPWVEVRQLEGHRKICTAAFSPDGRWLATGGSGGDTKSFWNFSKGQKLANNDGVTLRLWNLVSGAEVKIPESHGYDSIKALAFTLDGQLLATGGFDGQLSLWDVKSGSQARRVKSGHSHILSLAFSPDGQWLASGGKYYDTIKLWNVATGAEWKRFQSPGDTLHGGLVFSPDGRLLLSQDPKLRSCSGEMIRLWNVDTGACVGQLEDLGDSSGFSAMALSPDGQRVASRGIGEVMVWDLPSRAVVKRLSYSGYVSVLSFSPDGTRLLLGTLSRGLSLWDTETGVFHPNPHIFEKSASPRNLVLAISPNGQKVVTCSDETVTLWSTGAE